MSAYIIAIGGTGNKFIEAVAHAAAAGLFIKDSFTQDLQILCVDPDTGNGNLSAATTTLGIYQRCQNQFNGDTSLPWMQTKINSLGCLSPFKEADVRLRNYFRYDDYHGEKLKIQHLFDVLYTQGERDLYLEKGYKGRPVIGAAVMSQIENQEIWSALIDKIREDTDGNNRQAKVFLCGSIFGGTGASGFPTLGRLLAKELENRVKLGGLLILPYFQFPTPRNADEKEIYAKSEEFPVKTKAALDFYGTQKLKFDKVYLLGSPNWTVEKFSDGGGDQRNQPHFLELFATGAVREFLFTENPKKLAILARKDPNLITWDDVPERNEVKEKLVNATKFAFAWISAIVPDLDFARSTGRQNKVPWSLKFFNSQELRDEQEISKINAIRDWCEDYLLWIGKIHRYAGSNTLKLFNTHAFLEQNGELKREREEFPNLVVGSGGLVINRILANLENRNISQPNNRGTVGLAKALYNSIRKTVR